MNDDQEYQRAVEIVTDTQNGSTSFLQRSLGIGYNHAARLIERMEEAGIVSAAKCAGKLDVGKRDVLLAKGSIDTAATETVSVEQLRARAEGGASGSSAKSIVAGLLGHGTQNGDYPYDADDFGRCERLLDHTPELRPLLPRMAEVNAYWAALVPRWEDIRAASDKTALIQKIVRPIEAADPGCARFGDMTMRTGPITYAGNDAATPATEAMTRKGRPPMANDPDWKKHNQDAYNVAADELRQFIERYEQLEAEKTDIAGQQKEVMAEAKGRGYDTKVMRKVIALRKRKPDDVAEEEAVLDIYKQALGMV